MSIVWCAGTSLIGLPVQITLIGLLLVWGIFASGMATLIDPWGNVSALGFAAGRALG